jgi:hypothetical protein
MLIVSCAPVYVNFDYEKTTDFNTFKTYNFYPDMQSGLSELDTKRLLDILESQLQSRGFAISHHPDFLINIQSIEWQNDQRSNVGVGLGGGGGNIGGGISIGIPVGQANINRQIIFDFIDDGTSQLYWQAVSESSFSPNATPERREAQFQKIVDKILAGYPPKQKKK